MKLLHVVAFAVAIAACTTSPVSTCPQDGATHPQAPLPCPCDAGASKADSVAPSPVPVTPEGVCVHLAALGCQEGKAADCSATLAHLIEARVTDPKLACLAAAANQAEARACGTVACP